MARGVALGLLLVLSACAEPAPPSLEPGSTEALLSEQIWPRDPSLVSDLDCGGLDPSLIAQGLTCTARIDGELVTVVGFISEVGGAFARVAEPLFVIEDAADAFAARLQTDLGMASPPEIDCDRAVLIAEADASFACTVDRAGDTLSFEFVLLDDEGGWTLRP